jgi:hypothetical protein
MKNTKKLSAAFMATLFAVGVASTAFAATDTDLSISVVQGAQTLDIVDAAGAPVTDPGVAMSEIVFDFIDQTSAGTLGITDEKIRVYNPTATQAWTASMAATDGNTATWTGGSEIMDFNDAADAQLTINPSTGTITSQHTGIANVALGSQSSFDEGTTDSITLFSASTEAVPYNYYDLQGVSVSQLVPANQPVETYTLNLTLTLV